MLPGRMMVTLARSPRERIAQVKLGRRSERYRLADYEAAKEGLERAAKEIFKFRPRGDSPQFRACAQHTPLIRKQSVSRFTHIDFDF
jgi:hypothetical protein